MTNTNSKNPGRKIWLAVVCAILAAAAIIVSLEILEKRRQRVFYQADMDWYGDLYWKGKKSVDVNSPEDKIPFQIPGPADLWAGGESKEIRIKAPFDFKTNFTIRFLESHEASPPFMEVWADDIKVAAFQVEKGTGYPRIHWPREGKTSKASFTIPSERLKDGTTLTFKTTAGSWAVIQNIVATGKPDRWEYIVAAVCGALASLMVVVWLATQVAQSGMNARQMGFAAILMSFGLVIGLATAEVLFRALDVLPKPMATHPVLDFKLSSNPVMLYEYRPGIIQGEKNAAGMENTVSTNSAGFRDLERETAKQDGAYRLIILGDSTAAGSGIKPGEALFNRILEKKMAADLGKAKFEAINMGVHGYQTLQEIETLRVKGLAYNPDMVITLFCHNDFQLNVDGNTYYNLLQSNPEFNFKARTPGLSDLVIAKSRLVFVVYHRLMAQIKPPTNFDQVVNEYREKYLQDNDPVQRGMEIFSRLAKEKGFTAVMAILPVFDRPFDKYRHGYQHDRVKKVVEKYENIELWDLKDEFARIDNNAARFTTDGLHMSLEGHQGLAEIIYRKLKTRENSGKGSNK